jgi:hypothetical protein
MASLCPGPAGFFERFDKPFPVQLFFGGLGDKLAPFPFTGNVIDLVQNFLGNYQVGLGLHNSSPYGTYLVPLIYKLMAMSIVFIEDVYQESVGAGYAQLFMSLCLKLKSLVVSM